MGHQLGSFIQDLLSSVMPDGRRESVSLVVDNARMAVNTSKNRDLRKRFLPGCRDASNESCSPNQHLIRVPVRRQSLDVSDHERGETRWCSASVSSEVESSPMTPSRERLGRRQKPTSASPIQRGIKQLSPVMEEKAKRGLSGMDSKQLRTATNPSLVELRKPGSSMRRHQSGTPRRSPSAPYRHVDPKQTMRHVEQALAVCTKR